MLQGFHLSYEPHPLVGTIFDNVDISLRSGERVALVGRNGVGKTKLLEILAGKLKPKSGRVVLSSGDVIGYLPQDFEFGFEGTLDEFLWAEGMDSGLDTATLLVGLRKLGARLGLQGLEDRPYQHLSLGERMRAALLLLLCQDPTLLLLDEPTNHLDLEARLWLEAFLQECPQGVLMVCHDRAITDAVVERVLELSAKGITEYSGNYSQMLEAKAENFVRETEAWENQRSEDRRLRIAVEKTLQHAAGVSKRPTGRTYDPKSKAFYEGKQAKIEKRAKAIKTRVEHLRERAVEKPYWADKIALVFTSAPIRTKECISVRGLGAEFGSKPIFEGLNFTVDRSSRLAFVGPNGSGKTTVLRILNGEIVCARGTVVFAPGLAVGYLSQSRNGLNHEKTLMEALDVQTREQERRGRTFLGRLGMRGDIVFKKVGVLSVGERTKLEIAYLLMSEANLLMLDEPTNHLDVESLEALESALGEFPGPILFTSHDRKFVQNLATDEIHMGDFMRVGTPGTRI